MFAMLFIGIAPNKGHITNQSKPVASGLFSFLLRAPFEVLGMTKPLVRSTDVYHIRIKMFSVIIQRIDRISQSLSHQHTVRWLRLLHVHVELVCGNDQRGAIETACNPTVLCLAMRIMTTPRN